MSKSSMHSQVSSSSSSAHMSRESYVSYLIEHDPQNFEYKSFDNSSEYLEYAITKTKEITGRKMQKLAVDNFVQEAVINIKKDTTLQEIESLFTKLHNHYTGFKIFEVALHKDEGVFIDTKYDVNDLTFDSKNLRIYKGDEDVTNDVISLAPNRDIFFNKANKKWYAEKEFENEIDTTKLQKKMNYHAHVNYTKWDETTGRNARLNKNAMSSVQTLVANHLGMERGLKHSQTKRLNHWQIKKIQDEVNKQKKENQASEAEVKSTIAELRKELQLQKATRKDFAELEQINKDLKIKLSKQELEVAELEGLKINFASLKQNNTELKAELKERPTEQEIREKIEVENDELLNKLVQDDLNSNTLNEMK